MPKGFTGVDILVGTAHELGQTGEVPEALAEAFVEMLTAGYVRTALTPEETTFVRLDRRSDEVAASFIVALAARTAFEHGDAESQAEVMKVGVLMAMRFAEFLKMKGIEP